MKSRLQCVLYIDLKAFNYSFVDESNFSITETKVINQRNLGWNVYEAVVCLFWYWEIIPKLDTDIAEIVNSVSSTSNVCYQNI